MQAATIQIDLASLDREAEHLLSSLDLPPRPIVLTQVVREMRADEPDFNRIGNLVAGDIPLAATMLKTANSPACGLQTKVTTVHRALSVLGLRNVGQLVVGLLLRQSFAAGATRHMEELWDRSAQVAQITARIAREARLDRYEAHTFALFRDCGAAVMLRKHPGYAAVLERWVRGGMPAAVTEIESRQYDVNHAQVGYRFARGWELGEATCMAIRFHHEYPMWAQLPPESATLAALGLVADRLHAQHVGAKAAPEWSLGGPVALATLGLDESALEDWAAVVEDALAEA